MRACVEDGHVGVRDVGDGPDAVSVRSRQQDVLLLDGDRLVSSPLTYAEKGHSCVTFMHSRAPARATTAKRSAAKYRMLALSMIAATMFGWSRPLAGRSTGMINCFSSATDVIVPSTAHFPPAAVPW